MNPTNIPETKAKELVVSAKPVSLRELRARNVTGGGGATRYVMVFDSPTAVDDGTPPKYSFPLGAAVQGGMTPPKPIRFTSGIYVCSSTTDDTKTLSASDDIKWSADITPE